MKTFEWTRELEIGVEPIDYDHRMLIGSINELRVLIQSKDKNQLNQIIRVVDFLSSYVRYHFEREENFMVAMGFDLVDAHKTRHQQFKTWVDQLVIKCKNNPETVNLKDVHGKLVDWLTNHILKDDKLLAKLARENPEKVKKIIVNLI